MVSISALEKSLSQGKVIHTSHLPNVWESKVCVSESVCF